MGAETSFQGGAAAGVVADSSDAPSLLSLLGVVQSAIFYLVIWPLRLLFGQALPWILVNLFNAVLYLLSWIWTVARIGLLPVLLPLDILFVRPGAAILLLIYKSRYFIYFATALVLFGSAMGYLSSALTSSSHSEAVSSSFTGNKKYHKANRQQRSSSRPQKAAAAAPWSSSEEDTNNRDMERNAFKQESVKEDTSDQDRFALAMQSLAEKRRRLGRIP